MNSLKLSAVDFGIHGVSVSSSDCRQALDRDDATEDQILDVYEAALVAFAASGNRFANFMLGEMAALLEDRFDRTDIDSDLAERQAARNASSV